MNLSKNWQIICPVKKNDISKNDISKNDISKNDISKYLFIC